MSGRHELLRQQRRLQEEAIEDSPDRYVWVTPVPDRPVNDAALLTIGRPSQVEVRCSSSDSRRSCGQVAGEAWHTSAGDVLHYNHPYPDRYRSDIIEIWRARVRQHEDRVATGEVEPLRSWQRRAPVWMVAEPNFVFLDDVDEIPAICQRHGPGTLLLQPVREALREVVAGGSRKTVGWSRRKAPFLGSTRLVVVGPKIRRGNCYKEPAKIRPAMVSVFSARHAARERYNRLSL